VNGYMSELLIGFKLGSFDINESMSKWVNECMSEWLIGFV